MPYDEQDLGKLLAEVRRPFQSTRDPDWDRRRATRHLRGKPWLPEGLEIFKAAIQFNDPLPGFIINRIKQRLGANAVTISLHLRGDPGPAMQRQGENLENWFRGAHEEMDPIGSVDNRLREHQAADGVAVLELEALADYLPPRRKDGSSDAEYDEARDLKRRQYGLGIGAAAPDPRSLYWVPSPREIKLMAKVVSVSLVDVMNDWNAEGFRLAYTGDIGDPIGRVEKLQFASGEMPPAATVAEYGRIIRLVRITTPDYIYDCCYPSAISSSQGFSDDAPGTTPSLMLLGRYRNHFGRVPYYLMPARSTSDPDPAYAYEPLAKEVLDLAPYVNQWRTIRMIHGLLQALKPVHARPSRPLVEDANAAPKSMPDLWRPGFLEYDGSFGEIPTPPIPDFDKFDSTLASTYNSFNQSITSALLSGAIGKSTPAWSLLQITEEQVGLIKEALDSRATGWRQALEDTAHCVQQRSGRTGPVYVRSSRMSKEPTQGRVDVQVGLTAAEFDIPYRLSVTIDGMTQSQRAADTEYWRRLHLEGTITDETYEEHIGIEDRVTEQARKRRQLIMKPMEQDAASVARFVARQNLRRLHGPIIDVILPPTQAEMQMAAQAAEGAASAEMPPPDPMLDPNAPEQGTMGIPRSPGQGMPITPPTIGEQLRQNGAGPQTMNVGG